MKSLNRNRTISIVLARVTHGLTVLVAVVFCSWSASTAHAQQSNSGGVLEEVVVSGIRRSLLDANAVKRNAAQVVDAISAEDLGKFPDQNVAESLQRITGVYINRSAGEGSEITVRGFGPQFNVVRLNNRTLASLSSERGFDFQVLASELISGAEVVKTPTPDMWEGSIGANVNMKTARPLDHNGLQVVGSVQSRYQDLAENYGIRASGLVSNSFANDSLGVLLALSYEDRETRTEESFGNGANGTLGWSIFNGTDTVTGEPLQFRFPSRMGQGFTVDNRERLGIVSTVQYQPNDHFDLTFDATYIDFDRTQLERGTSVPTQFNSFTDVDVNENGTATAFTKTFAPLDLRNGIGGGATETTALGINGSYVFKNNFKLSGDVSWSRAEAFDESTIINPAYKDNNPFNNPLPPGDLANPALGNTNANFVNNTLTFVNGDVPTWNTTFDLSDPSLVRAHFQAAGANERSDEIVETRLDGDWAVNFGAVTGIKVGLFQTDREKDDLPYNSGLFEAFDPTAPNAPAPTLGNNVALFDPTDGIMSELELGTRPHVGGRFFQVPAQFLTPLSLGGVLGDESAVFPTEIVLTDLAGYCNWLQGASGNQKVCTLEARENDRKFVSEQTQGIYVRLDLDGEFQSLPWAANFGLRYVETETTAFGNTVELISIVPSDPDGASSGLIYNTTPDNRVTVKNKYDHVLPSFNLRVDLSEKVVLRGAASKVITRPSLEDIVPFQQFGGNFEAARRSGSNPLLEPFEALQFDGALEYYGETGNAFAVTLFYKKLETFISSVTTLSPTGVIHPAFGEVILADAGPKNRKGGTVQGYEVAGLYNFDFLPGFLRNVGIQANYTFVSSTDPDANNELAGELITIPSSGIEGFTPHSYNVSVFYEDENLQTRLAWNWRDEYLSARLGPSGLPAHFDDYGQLDFSLGYHLTDRYQLTFEASNILDNNTIWFQDIRERVLLNEYTGRRLFVGLRGSF